MNDIFYLCPEKIELEDIKDAFQKVEEVHLDVFYSSDTIQVKYKDKKIDFVIMNLSEFEDEVDSRMLMEKKYAALFVLVTIKLIIKKC